ncbi:hypothetical protein [Prevotella sp. oral taxon 313]|uniref:hypothetical protein n=1 Tax=Prevotella sp. oral taxon 313 TaxID=652722 RepID=UPI001E4E03C1|nr:hypothetical protein [Prevotella sp. oral taxon 313]
MKSFIVSIIIILGAYGFIYGLNKLFYRYSFFHSAPSIKTFSKGGLVWYFLSIIAFFGIFVGLAFSGIGFDLLYERGLFVYLPVLMIVLVSVAIVAIFRIEKSAWLRRNPQHCRLFFPSWNEGAKNMMVSISKIDDINSGRGVSFSWFDGSFLTAGRHRVEFVFYEERILSKRNMSNELYKKR